MNQKILHAALFMPAPEGWWGLPILLEGEPGTGKTHLIAEVAKRVALPFERLSPAERGEAAFGVVPVPQGDNYLHYPPPAWAKKFTDGGLLFLDEINCSPPALQAPLLGLVQLRTLGSHTFGPRTRVIAAMNSTRDAANGWDLAPPLANRFGHFEFTGLDPSEWVIAMIGGFAHGGEDTGHKLDALAEEKRVMEAWPDAIAMARGLVAGFIKARPELLHKRPNKGANASSRAWPSRRTVEYATYAVASSLVHHLSESDTDTFLAGFVGAAWMQEFATWRANADLPDPGDLLDGKVKWTHDPRRLDRTMAVLSAIAALVTPEKAAKRVERVNAAWGILGTVLKDAADVAMPAAAAMRRAQLLGAQYPASVKVLSALFPVMKEAGVA